jgi:cytochrome c-type protein NapC
MRGNNLFTRIALFSPVISIPTIFVAGIIFWGSLNWSIEMTNTESFCISCHEMEQNLYREYRNTAHYSNRTGVRATCPDCHVPREWTHKMIRKIRATNELYHWILGSIDTREKFQAKRYQLASHVWQSMRETDSRECRNCHGNDYMAREKQSTMASKSHQLGTIRGETCIDCHQGIAHQLPDEFDQEGMIDELHHRLEKQAIACHECHEDSYKPITGEEW